MVGALQRCTCSLESDRWNATHRHKLEAVADVEFHALILGRNTCMLGQSPWPVGSRQRIGVPGTRLQPLGRSAATSEGKVNEHSCVSGQQPARVNRERPDLWHDAVYFCAVHVLDAGVPCYLADHSTIAAADLHRRARVLRCDRQLDSKPGLLRAPQALDAAAPSAHRAAGAPSFPAPVVAGRVSAWANRQARRQSSQDGGSLAPGKRTRLAG